MSRASRKARRKRRRKKRRKALGRFAKRVYKAPRKAIRSNLVQSLASNAVPGLGTGIQLVKSLRGNNSSAKKNPLQDIIDGIFSPKDDTSNGSGQKEDNSNNEPRSKNNQTWFDNIISKFVNIFLNLFN
ncbi:MAG: hypothetical protein RLN81_12660 [Balneolaceae bacterium]